MPYKYIGRTTDFKGKTLWEIVGNLKNFGVGRIVVRSMLERYPEPTYFKILKVEPLPCPKVETMDNMRKVRVLVEKTFRGVTFPQPMLIEATSYKSDYRLLSKDEEENYCKAEVKEKHTILPRTMDFPPLLKEFILREKRLNGEDLEQDLKLEVIYRESSNTNYKIAEEGQEPTVKLQVNMKDLPNISLYKNVKIST